MVLAPGSVLAQTDQAPPSGEKTFKAIVVEVLGEQNATTTDGDTITQQDLKIKGLNGEFKDREITIKGIGEPPETGKNVYHAGEQVIVQYAKDDQGQDKYEVTDFVRTGSLLWLAIIFVVMLIGIGRWKGLRAILSLVLTFIVIIRYIVPQILDGADPIIVTVIGSFAILLSIIYITEGFNRRSHVSTVSIFVSLVFTVFLSWLFVGLAKLSGLANEEASFIMSIGAAKINLQGLLLAGIIIGTLGVLDDIALAQVATVEELHLANPAMTKVEVYRRAINVGVTHISAMANTLFLAYAGASLPLLILFVSGQSGFASWDIAINNEILATEIVRTLAGSIGLVFAVPISTLVAVWWLTGKRRA